MPGLTEKIISSLKSGCAEEVNDALTHAAYLFEKANNTSWKDESWTDEVKKAKIEASEIEKLKAKLIEFVESNQAKEFEDPAVWALGKCFDANLKPFFIKVVKQSLNEGTSSFYQAMIALNNLGENFFGKTSWSAIDEQENRELAKRYLKHIEVD